MCNLKHLKLSLYPLHLILMGFIDYVWSSGGMLPYRPRFTKLQTRDKHYECSMYQVGPACTLRERLVQTGRKGAMKVGSVLHTVKDFSYIGAHLSTPKLDV